MENWKEYQEIVGYSKTWLKFIREAFWSCNWSERNKTIIVTFSHLNGAKEEDLIGALRHTYKDKYTNKIGEEIYEFYTKINNPVKGEEIRNTFYSYHTKTKSMRNLNMVIQNNVRNMENKEVSVEGNPRKTNEVDHCNMQKRHSNKNNGHNVNNDCLHNNNVYLNNDCQNINCENNDCQNNNCENNDCEKTDCTMNKNLQLQNINETNRKGGKIFFITLSSIEINDQSKKSLLNHFKEQLISYCICLEISEKSDNTDKHLHAFLEFKECIKVNDLRKTIISMYNNYHIDVQPCKSRKACLIYITKEDNEPLTNIKISELSFRTRMKHWVKSNSEFSCEDPFVAEHKNNWRYLMHYHHEYWSRNKEARYMTRPVEKANDNWSLMVSLWWNEWHHKHYHKRKCLYLWGPSNTGKTTVIESIIEKENMPFVFYPESGMFFMQSYINCYHQIIVFEEYDHDDKINSHLKRLLEGSPMSYSVKGGSSKSIIHKGPIIFISNHRIITDEALNNRLYFVHANCPFWEDPIIEITKEITDRYYNDLIGRNHELQSMRKETWSEYMKKVDSQSNRSNESNKLNDVDIDFYGLPSIIDRDINQIETTSDTNPRSGSIIVMNNDYSNINFTHIQRKANSCYENNQTRMNKRNELLNKYKRRKTLPETYNESSRNE